MNYEEFLERIKEELQQDNDVTFYPKGYENEERSDEIRQYNLKHGGEDSTVLLDDVISITTDYGNNISSEVSFMPHELYSLYRKDGWEAALKNVRSQVKETNGINMNFMRSRQRGDYEELKEKLILRPLNNEKMIKEKKDCVYKRTGDVLLVLYQLVAEGETLMTSRIHRDELDIWQVSQEKALKDALENTCRLFPPIVCNWKKNDADYFLEEECRKEDIMYAGYILLSTNQAANGAVSIFYPGVIEKMMKILNGPFMIVFANTTDVMVFEKDSPLIPSACKIAKEGNQFGDILSDKCYLCDEKGVRPMLN